MREDITLDTIPTRNLFFCILSSKFKHPALVKYLNGSDFVDSYYVTFYNAKQKFRNDKGSQFKTYVYTSIINTAYKNLKKKKPVLFSELHPDDMSEILNTKVDQAQNEYNTIYLKELIQLANLKPDEINLLNQRFFQDISEKEIAQSKSVTRQNINQKIQRIIRKLKEADTYGDYELKV